MYITQRLEQPMWTGLVTLSTTAATLLSLIRASGVSGASTFDYPQGMQAVVITNVDSSITVYLDVDANLATNSFEEALNPSDVSRTFKRLTGRSGANKIYLLAASGTPKCKVNIYQ